MRWTIGLDDLAILYLEKHLKYPDDEISTNRIIELGPPDMRGFSNQTVYEDRLIFGDHVFFLIQNEEYMWSRSVLVFEVETNYNRSMPDAVILAYKQYVAAQ